MEVNLHYHSLLLLLLLLLFPLSLLGPNVGIGIANCILELDAAPSSPTDPSPSDFPNLLQYNAYQVIQRFKQTITCDPNNVTATWVGYRPCDYAGFACATPPNLKNTPTIASVDFNGFHLCAPTISGFIDQLPDLAIFHANSNNFGGTVPNLASLPYIYELDLSSNQFSGQFPSDLLMRSQLIFVDIRFNSFVGSLPSGIFLLDLDVLLLNNNGFSQPLPASIGASRAGYLTLANNGFTGPIPPTISNSSDTLIEVLFLNNRLSGCLPYQIGLLQNATVFDAGFNQLMGPIPLSFACLKSVEQLNLAGNLLHGHVPSILCRLAKSGRLTNLSLSGNYFNSIGLECRELIRSGVLDVSQNCINGLPNQRSMWECVAFLPKMKQCPLSMLIPCVLRRPEVDNAVPPSPTTAKPPAASVAYSALHNPNANGK